MGDDVKQNMRKRAGTRRQASPRRPYVRDTWRPGMSPQEAAYAGLGIVALALTAGFLVGLSVYAIMRASTWLTGLLWDDVGGAVRSAWFPLALCTVGGLVIGLWTRFSGNRIASLETVMQEFRQTGRYDLHGPGKSVVSFLLPLVFGGSVGFEAGLTGIITAACCWIRDRLKRAGLRAGAVADVTIAATLSAVFGAPLAGIVAGAESMPAGDEGEPEGDGGRRALDAYDMRRGAKLVLYLAAAIGAFGGITLLSGVFGVESGLPRFGDIRAAGAEFLWAVPCLVAAYLLTLVYHAANCGFARLSHRLEASATGVVAAPVVAGVVLGCMAMAFPYVLYPGEAQCHELMDQWQTWTALALVATAVLKAIATPMCIRMGWMGGSFFPCIFAGVACGYGLAAIAGADPMLMVTMTTSAFLAGVTRKPLLSVAILALCFPLSGILWSGLAAIVGGVLPVPRTWLE